MKNMLVGVVQVPPVGGFPRRLMDLSDNFSMAAGPRGSAHPLPGTGRQAPLRQSACLRRNAGMADASNAGAAPGALATRPLRMTAGTSACS